jgi:hypothetical protein
MNYARAINIWPCSEYNVVQETVCAGGTRRLPRFARARGQNLAGTPTRKKKGSRWCRYQQVVFGDLGGYPLVTQWAREKTLTQELADMVRATGCDVGRPCGSAVPKLGTASHLLCNGNPEIKSAPFWRFALP